MPINPNSRLRKVRTVIHGWREGDVFYTSLSPRADKAPANAHDSAQDALREASSRHLPIAWDNPADIA